MLFFQILQTWIQSLPQFWPCRLLLRPIKYDQDLFALLFATVFKIKLICSKPQKSFLTILEIRYPSLSFSDSFLFRKIIHFPPAPPLNVETCKIYLHFVQILEQIYDSSEHSLIPIYSLMYTSFWLGKFAWMFSLHCNVLTKRHYHGTQSKIISYLILKNSRDVLSNWMGHCGARNKTLQEPQIWSGKKISWISRQLSLTCPLMNSIPGDRLWPSSLEISVCQNDEYFQL